MDTVRMRSFRFDDDKHAYRAASAIRDLNDPAVWELQVVTTDGSALIRVPMELWTRRPEVADIVAAHGGRPA